MTGLNISEKILIEELTSFAINAKQASKGLSIGYLIKMIRNQLGMSQKNLADKAKVPQSTVSRIEKGEKDTSLATLHKLLDALFCDLLIVPILRESIDSIRYKQAKKKAKEHIQYLKGTMNLEDQQPDARLIEELLVQEENRLLQNPGSKLWNE